MQLLFLFKIFGIPFFSYTTLVMIGITLALVMALWQARQAERPVRWASEAFGWTISLSVLLGRIFHLFYNTDYYLERPTQIWRFADGGISFVGVFVGASIGLWIWSRRQRIPFWQAADWAALPAALVATFAWLGAFMYGSQYGAPAENGIALELRDTFGIILARWPTQLLAASWSAVIGLMLILQGRIAQKKGKRQACGAQAMTFLVAYSIGLFLMDFTRGDASIYILGLRLTQCLYLVLFLVAIFRIGRKS